MQDDVRLTMCCGYYFDLKWSDTAETDTQNLRHCFLGGKSIRESLHPTSREGQLPAREHTIEKGPTSHLDRSPEGFKVYAVDPSAHSRFQTEVSRCPRGQVNAHVTTPIASRAS